MQQVWRWLFDRKNNISSADRTDILLMFKKVVYADSFDEMEEWYEELISSNIISKYPNLVTYFVHLNDYREDWTLCSRKHLRIRGNNTNNLVEAQFLVLKDEVLNRTKEINVNGLLDKLTHEFEDHYKVKLLNVSSGKFDGCYSRRFKGFGKAKGEGTGFKMPSQQEKDNILSKIAAIGDKLYKVPSFSDVHISYTVDMNVGICECHVGQNGSVCKHQYLLWVSNIESTSNFLPFLDANERRKYAEIAIGGSLSIDFYEGIHDRLIESFESTEQNFDDSDFNVKQQASASSRLLKSTDMRRSIETISPEECKQELQSTLLSLQNKIDTYVNDSNFLSGVMKFCERVQKFPLSRLSSSLHNFGAQSSASLKITATSTLKKARKGKIYVQPEAVKRRKTKNGSKKATVKGMNVKNNPFDKEVSKKRMHKFSLNVASNEAVSKKAGRTMVSKTKHLCKKSKQEIFKNEG